MLSRKWILLLLPVFCADGAVPKELQAIADQARALPPEFAAAVLLKVAASPLATDPKWKHGVIDDAFLSAADAAMPFLKHGNPRAALAELLSSRVSRLSLQTSAIEAMLTLDPQHALVMFEDLGALELPQLSCQDPHTPDVSVYYSTAADLFARAFTPTQRKKGDDIQFLRRRVAAVQSPSQVVPALKLLDQVSLSPEDREELAARFVAALDGIHGGDREFAASEPLLVSAAVPEMHESPAFLAALRAYIVRQLSGPRCSDNGKAGELPESVTGFNKLISQVDRAGTQFRPITAGEIVPSKDEGTYALEKLTQSVPDGEALRTMTGRGHKELDSAEWMADYMAALEQIESWNTEGEIRSYLISGFYQSILDTPVVGAPHQKALASALHFLEQQYDMLPNRGLWFQEYRQLFSAERLSAANPEQAWLLDQLIHSRNAVISVYAQLQKLTGAS